MDDQKKIVGAAAATGLAMMVGATYFMAPQTPTEQVMPTELSQPEGADYVPSEPVIEEAPKVTVEDIGPLPGEVEAEKPSVVERVKRYFRPKPKKEAASKPKRLQGEKSRPNTNVTVSRTDKTYKLYSPPSITYQRHQSWGQMNSNKTAGYGDFEGYGADFGRTKSAYRGK